MSQSPIAYWSRKWEQAQTSHNRREADRIERILVRLLGSIGCGA